MMIGYINDWLRYYETIRELSRLTDRELKDIGMTRGEIVYEAYNQWIRSTLS
jgi:uncharacterized protein YjiS (DUF1127 family)